MDLKILWFILVAVLYCGYFILDGFDLGVGILLPFIAKTDLKRRVIINTFGPHWDANEVWLLTAGGATFAAFPHWYATLFSGFYIPFFLLLVGLILRGVSIEFRSKNHPQGWRSFWDWGIFAGSLIPALLLGVAFSNFVAGIPIDQSMTYTGGFFNLLNPFAIVGGLLTILLFTLHGGLFLSIKTEGDTLVQARNVSTTIWLPTFVVQIAFTAYFFFATDTLTRGSLGGIILIISTVLLLLTGWFVRQKKNGLAFGLNSGVILTLVVAFFSHLFPRVLISSTDPSWSLTVYNAASGTTTLNVMTIVTLVFIPIILVYQGWSYWIFRKRISDKPEQLHY